MIPYDNFKNVFFASKRPYWWLFLGKNKNGPQIGTNSEVSDMEESWSLLEDLIDNYGDGVYTIEVKTSVTAPKSPMHTFFVGERAAAVGFSSPVSASDSFTKGVDMRYWLDKIDAANDRIRTLELECLRLQNQLDIERRSRKDAEAGQPDALGRILNVVEKNPAVLGAITGLFGAPASAAIGVLTHPEPIPDNDEDEDEDNEGADNDFSIDRAVVACYRLINALPDLNINDLLERLADTATADPGKIRTAIQFL